MSASGPGVTLIALPPRAERWLSVDRMVSQGAAPLSLRSPGAGDHGRTRGFLSLARLSGRRDTRLGQRGDEGAARCDGRSRTSNGRAFVQLVWRPAMRLTAGATCLSWIPRTAVEGAFELPFGWGVAHYDNPPPDAFPDVDGLLRGDAIRFANQVRAWIDVEDGRVSGHGMSGGGRLGSTTVRLKNAGLTFAGVALPDLVGPTEVLPDRVRFRQTSGGHTGAPVPRAIPHAPFVRVSAPIAWST